MNMSERKTQEQIARENRERAAIQQAQQQQKCVNYIDDDGCGITVTPGGHVFYNVEDWY
jgi:hypothetical protein